VILFQKIVQISYRAVLAILLQSSLSLKLDNGWWVSGVLVGVNNPRGRMVVSAQGLGSESARRPLESRLAPKKEVDRRTAGIHGPV